MKGHAAPCKNSVCIFSHIRLYLEEGVTKVIDCLWKGFKWKNCECFLKIYFR